MDVANNLHRQQQYQQQQSEELKRANELTTEQIKAELLELLPELKNISQEWLTLREQIQPLEEKKTQLEIRQSQLQNEYMNRILKELYEDD